MFGCLSGKNADEFVEPADNVFRFGKGDGFVPSVSGCHSENKALACTGSF